MKTVTDVCKWLQDGVDDGFAEIIAALPLSQEALRPEALPQIKTVTDMHESLQTVPCDRFA